MFCLLVVLVLYIQFFVIHELCHPARRVRHLGRGCNMSAACTLIEYIYAFNVEYKEEFNTKNYSVTKLLMGIKTSLNNFQVELSKVFLSSQLFDL